VTVSGCSISAVSGNESALISLTGGSSIEIEGGELFGSCVMGSVGAEWCNGIFE
jgi:hypothetical protein